MSGSKLQDNSDKRGQNRPFVDVYEVLQLSPRADNETIERVYRLLAQRYHPNNKKTGNEKAFRELLEAYRILSDPEKRAAYDAEYQNQQKIKWTVFDEENAAQGKRAAKQVRRALISVLYTKRMNDLDNPGMTIREVETLTGVPREHLFAAAWYLREKGLIEVSGQGRYAITAAGMDFCEDWDDPEVPGAPGVSASTTPETQPEAAAAGEPVAAVTKSEPAAGGGTRDPQPVPQDGTSATSSVSPERAGQAPTASATAPGGAVALESRKGTETAAPVKPKAALNSASDGQVMRSLRKLSMATLNPMPASPAQVMRPSRVDLQPRAVFCFAQKRG